MLRILLPALLAVALACGTPATPTPEPTMPTTPTPERLNIAGCPDAYRPGPEDATQPHPSGRLKRHLASLERPPLYDREELACLQAYLYQRTADIMGDFYTAQQEQHPGKEPEVYPPYFGAVRPVTHFATPSRVYVFLSPEAAVDWNRAYYQLAHEMVHIRDGIGKESKGPSNYLEEGIAECFAQMQSSYDLLMIFSLSFEGPEDQYHAATSLVTDLFMADQPEPGRTCHNIRNHHDEIAEIRKRFGSLGSATFEGLKELYPDAAPGLIEKLAAPFEHQG